MGPVASPVLILDTSVVVKWFRDQDESDIAQARQVRDAFLSGRCVLRAPDLLLVELANALTTGHRSEPNQVKEALRAVRDIELDLVRVQLPTLARAVELASKYRMTVYDACFLAVAIESDGLLLTADERFLKQARSHPAVASLAMLKVPS